MLENSWEVNDILVCRNKPDILPINMIKGNKYTVKRLEWRGSLADGQIPASYTVFIDDEDGSEVGLGMDLFVNISLNQRMKEAMPPKEKIEKEKVNNKITSVKIILTCGISGSGKSTWANEQVIKSQGGMVNVTKDDLRHMLCGHDKNDDRKFTKGQENFILTVRDSIVRDSLFNGISVIVSDTNLHPKHEARMIEIANEFMSDNPNIKVKVEVKSFLDVPIETCIKRDLKRSHSLGEAVLRRQFKDYLNWNGLTNDSEKKFIPLVQDKTLKPCIIVDLDGTTALFKNIYKGTDENGKHFFETIRDPYNAIDCHLDIPNPFVINLVNMYKKNGYIVLFVSGRKDIYKEKTIKFLSNQFDWCQKNNKEFYLYMRKKDDNRADNIIKKEIFDEFIKNKFYMETCIDDRDKVVKMWRYELGLNVLQVADGDF